MSTKGAKSIPTAADFTAKKSSTGFSCSMDGYRKMTQEITQLLIAAISLYKSVLAAILPENLALALTYFYDGLTGINNWLGFAVAAVYYLAEDQGFGTDLCELSGYGDAVVEALSAVINFSDKTEDV